MGGTVPFEISNDQPYEHLSAELLKWLEGVFGTGGRTIRRWFAKGAPLHRPEAMPDWWQKHMTLRCPPGVLEAAARSRGESAPPAGPAPVEIPATEASISLSDFSLAEGAAVEGLRRLMSAQYKKLEDAISAGHGIDLANRRYLQTLEAWRKVEASERLAQKQRGELVAVAVVKSDIETAAEMLRQMGESMARRVLEMCPSLDGEQQKQVAAAINRVREQECLVFQNIRSLKTPSDVVTQLAA